MIKKTLQVLGSEVTIHNDYISLTDIARYKNADEPKDVVANRLRLRNTVDFLGLRETINNPNFKGVEFDPFKRQAGTNAFTLSASKWIEVTDAIGLISKVGRHGGGTFAHKDIAIKFASRISVEFELYLIKEFQRLKEQKYKGDEADVLNMALFGKTVKQRREDNVYQKGNIRDQATIEQLIVLANMESLNAEYIKMNIPQSQRIQLLNQTAITQMKSLITSNMNAMLSRGEN